ncbi:molybdopterin-dependent oxidoreductase [Massilia pinisoli]|uniref:Molybdopterin-dependent oxidoreductase n=1 Tax=Massilia pinisoli TaxID=1772194 RepID=A0ABT1ZSM9_9BURK|nr:molybdopterin-dependent oxidoreductase [Massilia pinisoli]MCS0582933.1 molybdopterin-dependent oxidoreductase [Massilia pinisoli]
MNKRQFLGAAAVAGTFPIAGQAAQPSGRGPTLLTVTGAIARSNRGPLDPALDQMMHKHQVTFAKAYGFDYADLQALPAQTIRPTLEYDGKPHTLRGPLLTDVLARVGAVLNDKTILVLRAVDGYNVELPVAQARARRVIVATHVDGNPMPLGGLGPLWAVYDADRVPEMAALPLAQRFAACPWALYHVDVKS